MAERNCPQHGPYDASYGSCPRCNGTEGRPADPGPLNEEYLETDLEGGRIMSDKYASEASTELPGGFGKDRENYGDDFYDNADPTEIPEDVYEDLDRTEIDGLEPDVMAILWVKEGPRRGKPLPLRDGDFIGRSKGAIITDDSKVSNPHARIVVEEEKFVIWDCGSRNGTYVNEEKIRCATTLEENDIIKIGDTVFVIKVLE